MTVALSLPPEVLALGALDGLAYGLLAAGLVLTFRLSRVLNLAQAQIGAFTAVILAQLVVDAGLGYWPAFALAIAAGAAIGAALDVAVVRRLSSAPPLVPAVGTLIVATALGHLAGLLRDGEGFPQPAGLPSPELGALTITPSQFALAVAAPVLVVGLTVLLRYTRSGAALRAAAANPEAARALGLPVGWIVAGGWALAGALAAVTGILVGPDSPFAAEQSLAAGLLLRALAIAALAGMSSLPAALVGGVGVGMLEQALLWNDVDPSLLSPVLLAVIVVGLAVRRPLTGREVSASSWLLSAPLPPLPEPIRRLRVVRVGRGVLLAVGLAAAVLVPQLLDTTDNLRLTDAACLTLVALSAWIVCSLAGELSLGQYAIAGFGAAVAASVARTTGSPLVGVAAAPVAGAVLAVLLAFPARDRTLSFAAVTLGFALAAPDLLGLQGILGSGEKPAGLFGAGTETASAALVTLVLALAIVLALVGGDLGRRLRALRDNARAARALGVGSVGTRMTAMALAGALAGLAGAILADELFVVTPGAFPPGAGVDAVVAVVVGGLASPVGAALGAIPVLVFPALVSLSEGARLTLTLGWLAALLAAPGGLVSLLAPIWSRALRSFARPTPWGEGAPLRVGAGTSASSKREGMALSLEGASKSYAGVQALRAVRLHVPAGQAVAIVGPNGAGKTTLLDLVGGATAPDSGRVLVDGEDVTLLPPERRAARGLVRCHQEPVLFPTLTVAELMSLACRLGGEVAPSRDWLLRRFGLEERRDQRLDTLSTGTSRVAELASAVARRPRLLALDEPSAGLAQAEVEPLADLLAQLHAELGVTLVLVEHDPSLVARVAERVVVLDEGTLVADGKPAEVLGDRGGTPR